jgi:hypothetical protein
MSRPLEVTTTSLFVDGEEYFSVCNPGGVAPGIFSLAS